MSECYYCIIIIIIIIIIIFHPVSGLLSELSRSDVNKFDFIFIPWRVKNFEFYSPSHVYVIKFPGFIYSYF